MSSLFRQIVTGLTNQTLKLNLNNAENDPLAGLRPPVATSSEAGLRSLHNYLDNRATSAHRVKSKQIKSRSYAERLSDKTKTKGALAALLHSIGEHEQADKVNLCGSRFRVLTCGSHIVARTPFEKCNFRFCPFCAARRAQKFADKYLTLSRLFIRRFGAPLTPVHLTITQSHISGETYADARKRLLANFKKLTRRAFWKTHFAGALVAVDATKANDGCWHVHLHLTAFRRRFFDSDALRAEWLAVTGDSHVLKLQLINNLRNGLQETIKYAVKPADISEFSGHDLRQLLATKGKKNLFTIGEFSNFCARYELTEAEQAEFEREKVDFVNRDDDGELLGFAACPTCGGELFEVNLTAEKLIFFARSLETAPRGSPL